MTDPITVHQDGYSPGNMYLAFVQDEDHARFYLSRHDARRLGHALLAATDREDENPMRWTTRVERDEKGNVTFTAPPENGWPSDEADAKRRSE